MSYVPLPVGSLTMYAGATAPNNWLVCDGSAVSRATYAALFAAISTTWGAGDGSTTFNLPDLRGRSPVGVGTGAGLTARSLAASGGEETHVIASGELAAHSHGVSDPGHNHTQNAHSHSHSHGVTDSGHAHNTSDGAGHTTIEGRVNGTSGGIGWATPGQSLQSHAVVVDSGTTGVSVNSDATGTTPTNQSNTTGLTTSNTGSGAGHNTMHPFAAVNYIIKAL